MTNSETFKNIVAALIALIVGLVIFQTYNIFVNRTVSWILVKGQFSQDTKVEFFSTTDGINPAPLDSVFVKGKSGIQQAGSNRVNAPWEKLKLVFTNNSDQPNSTVNISSVIIYRAYNDNLVINANQFDSFFDLSSPSVTSNSDSLAIANAGNVNALVSKQTISKPEPMIAFAWALLFSFAVYFIIKHAHWSAIPAFSDMNLGRDISNKHEFGIINGLRGLAALLVLFSHTAPGFHAVQVGLALLFVISGFLLTKPFVIDPGKIYSYYNIEVYLTKRLKRILPMYYLYIFLIYVVALKIDVALRHFIFVQAEGHLWPMTQIFAFYFLLPFILLITSALYRIARILPIVVLALVCYYWIVKMGRWMPFYNGVYYHPFFLYAFLMGVIGSYLQYGFLASSNTLQNIFNRFRWPIGIIALITAVLTIAWSAPVKPPQFILPYISQFYVKCLACLALILFAVNNRNTIYSWIMSNWLFRSVGIVGFSFYILHGLGMQIVLAVQKQLLAMPNPSERSWSFMLMTFVVTYVMSVITYSYVERPFFGFRKRKNNVE